MRRIGLADTSDERRTKCSIRTVCGKARAFNTHMDGPVWIRLIPPQIFLDEIMNGQQLVVCSGALSLSTYFRFLEPTYPPDVAIRKQFQYQAGPRAWRSAPERPRSEARPRRRSLIR